MQKAHRITRAMTEWLSTCQALGYTLEHMISLDWILPCPGLSTGTHSKCGVPPCAKNEHRTLHHRL